jgi:signal transduction histidine kinase
MSDEPGPSIILRPKELQAVYAISLAIVQTADIDVALDQIVKLTRHVFIFDNMVLYLNTPEKGFEPAYARVIGRGKSAEADLAWGEEAANKAFFTQQTVVRTEKLDGWEMDRLCWRDFLGLPLRRGEQELGALVFGRFGGPPYQPEQIRLAEFIAAQVCQLLEHHRLLEKVATLEAERKLQQLQDDFIATVSHELCTPLGFIKGYTTTLLRQDTSWDDATRREFLEIIDEEADRLRGLIDDLLDSSRLQSGTMRFQFQRVHLEQLLREVMLRAASRYDTLKIQLKICPDAVVCADPVRLAQVFDNIINNAVKYANKTPIYITVDSKNSGYQIGFHDSGPGIDPEHIEHIFDRFYRAGVDQSKVHGTGLGLYICRQIIQLHGGKIWATSQINKGTTIWIELPFDNNQDMQEKSL